MKLQYFMPEERGGSLGMPERSASTLGAIIVVPILLWAVSIVIAATYPAVFRALASEDGPIEVAQAVVLLGCVLFSACIALALHRRNSSIWSFMYYVFAAACLWTAGEEISWGQRLAGLATPEWLAHNQQGEANLHNLPGVGSTLHNIVIYALWAMVVLSLVTSYWNPSKRARWRTELWVPPPILIPTWLCFLSYSWIRALDQWWFQRDHVATTVSRLQEPAEFILYGGVLVFLTMVLAWVRSGMSPALVERTVPAARTGRPRGLLAGTATMVRPRTDREPCPAREGAARQDRGLEGAGAEHDQPQQRSTNGPL